jgi:hypothetical protein
LTAAYPFATYCEGSLEKVPPVIVKLDVPAVTAFLKYPDTLYAVLPVFPVYFPPVISIEWVAVVVASVYVSLRA